VVTGPEIPGYTLLDVIGRGGYGTVYRARQVAVDREVAIKVDNRALTSERDQRRFLREVRAAGQLSAHPHVVKLYDAGTLPDGRPYLVMERCRESLHEVSHRIGPMPPERVRDLGVRLADALSAAHAAGILHRDIKPANILVNEYGVVGLSDFGLAAILDTDGAQTATVDALTPAFAAPEAFHGVAPTPLFDVYSLAATLWTLLAGRPPRLDDAMASVVEILRSHSAPLPPLPGAPPALVEVLSRALEIDPARRTPSATALRDGLAAVDLTRTGPVAGPVPMPTPQQVPMPTPEQAPRQIPQPAPTAQPGPAPAARWPLWTGVAAGSVGLLVVGGFLLAGPLGHRADDPASADGGTASVTSSGPATSAPSTSSPGTSAGATDGTDPTATTPGPLPVEGTTVGCAATEVAPQARCPALPECWGGPVYIGGQLSAVRSRPCGQAHVWETFAIAPIPESVSLSGGADHDAVRATGLAGRLCTRRVLGASLTDAARVVPLQDWQVDVMTPTQAQLDAGHRSFRCVATVSGQNEVGSAIRGGSFRVVAAQ
jgi:serine/threonine protein kinase